MRQFQSWGKQQEGIDLYLFLFDETKVVALC